MKFPHIRTIDDVKVGILARTDGKIPTLASGVLLVGQQSPARTEVGVRAIFLRLVMHLEVIGDGELAGRGDAEKGIAVVAIGGESGGIQSGVENTVGVEHEDVAAAIRCHAGAGAPDCAFIAVWSQVEHGGLRQRINVVTHDPAGVRTNVTVRCPGQKHRAATEQEAGALFILGGIEDHIAAGAVVAGAVVFGGDIDGAAVEFAAVRGIEGMEP